MALHEHFCDSGGIAIVAVNLERRAGIEETSVEAAPVVRIPILKSRRLDEGAYHRERVVAVSDSRPERDSPGHRPAGRVVAPHFKRALCRGEKEGSRLGGDLIAREEAVEMGHMAVVHLCLREIFPPLLQLACLVDPKGSEFGELTLEFGLQFGIYVEDRLRFDCAREEFADNRHIHRRALTDRGRLCRSRF